MKLAILTTETLHHNYFVQEIARHHEIELIVEETQSLQAPFATFHPFEAEREQYEQARWFQDQAVPALQDFAPLLQVKNINDKQAVNALNTLQPEVILVFGTGRIKAPLIRSCEQGILNLHGGNPERYRGLDSHLWAVYHRDFDALDTCLHRLNAELDDGEIIMRIPIPLEKDLPLHALRAVNTECCVELCRSALATYQALGKFLSYPQSHKGRYYSFMPQDLKALCLKRFERHTATLT